MIGPLEIVILIVILLLIFHKRLPGLGRSAGTQAKMGTEKARELYDASAPKAKELAEKASVKGGEVGSKVGDRIDPAEIGRKAGSAAREARDMRSEFKGFLDPPPKQPAAAPGPAADAARRPDAPATAAEAEAPADAAKPADELAQEDVEHPGEETAGSSDKPTT